MLYPCEFSLYILSDDSNIDIVMSVFDWGKGVAKINVAEKI